MKTAWPTNLLPLVLPLALMLPACTPTRVVLVPAGTPVRLAEPIKARVWAKDSEGKAIKSRNKVTIPEGWYALPKD